MPTFGDFETVGEPVGVTDERDHVATVWRARKSGAEGRRTYAIKYYAPQRQAKAPSSDDQLGHDGGLKFLEGIKDLRKASQQGGRCLACVYDLGVTAAGAWYATDFYPRTLEKFITLRGKVDAGGLRQVVGSVVAGCLALHRSRGYSHGNLKTGNIYLVGRPRALRQTAIQLGDPYPAAPRQLSRLDTEQQQMVGELLRETVEANDLRSIGELILQLVEGRIIPSGDHEYPIRDSPVWRSLGKQSDRWRELCNRLLDPHLSLETVNLEKLAREFRPSAVRSKVLIVLAIFGAIGLVVGSVFLASLAMKPNFESLMKKGKDFEQRGEFLRAVAIFTKAGNLVQDSRDELQKKEAQSELNRAKGLAASSDVFRKSADEGEKDIGLQQYTQAGLEYGKAEAAAHQLGDSGKEKEASEDQQYATNLAVAERARQAVPEDYAKEVAALSEALKYQSELAKKHAAEVGRWSEAARKRQADDANAVTRKKRDDELKMKLAQAQEDGKKFFEAKQYGKASGAFGTAVEAAQQLEEQALAHEAEQDQQYATNLAVAERARQAVPEDYAKEVAALSEALKYQSELAKKHAAEVGRWSEAARKRQADDANAVTRKKRDDELKMKLAQAQEDGKKFFEAKQYGKASGAFGTAVEAAQQLEEQALAHEAEQDQQYATNLAVAERARQAVPEDYAKEVAALSEALKYQSELAKKHAAEVGRWSEAARKRQADDANAVTRKKRDDELKMKLAQAQEDGKKFFEAKQYGKASGAFGTAVEAAQQLEEQALAHEAEQDQQYATNLAVAERARQAVPEDYAKEVAALSEALKYQSAFSIKNKSAAKELLAEAQDRKLQNDLQNKFQEGQRFLDESNYLPAATDFLEASNCAVQLKRPSDRQQAEAGAKVAKALSDAGQDWQNNQLDKLVQDLKAAMAETSAPTSATFKQRMANWLADAQKQLAEKAHPPKNDLFGVAGFNFVWVTGMHGGGAYVENAELSQRIFSFYGGHSNQKQWNPEGQSGDEYPINLTFEEATDFCHRLNATNFAGGQFVLPTKSDFLTYSEAGSVTSENVEATNLVTLLQGLEAYTRILNPNKQLTNLRKATEGNTNRFGLFNVLGNAWEWCDDKAVGVPAGFSIASSGVARSRRLFAERNALEQEQDKDIIGVRLLYIIPK